MTNKEKCIAFSFGEFEKVYKFIAKNAVWTIIEESSFSGREAIIAHTKKVSDYFQSLTTNFTCHTIIAEENKVVIIGDAEFIKDGILISFVTACDIYEFNEDDEFVKMDSFCISKKSDE